MIPAAPDTGSCWDRWKALGSDYRFYSLASIVLFSLAAFSDRHFDMLMVMGLVASIAASIHRRLDILEQVGDR